MAPEKRVRVHRSPPVPPSPTRQGKTVHYQHSFISGYRAELNSLTGRLTVVYGIIQGLPLFTLSCRDWKDLERQTKTKAQDWAVSKGNQNAMPKKKLKFNRGVLSVGLVDRLAGTELKLEDLTDIGRGMVRHDLKAFLDQLDELDAKENA